MIKVYESTLHGWGESAEKVYVYALESDEEYWSFNDMSHQEKCDLFDVFDDSGYEVMPGAIYKTYEFEVSLNHVIMIERLAYNV